MYKHIYIYILYHNNDSAIKDVTHNVAVRYISSHVFVRCNAFVNIVYRYQQTVPNWFCLD